MYFAACPPCYDDIQRSVNEIRHKLRLLENIKNNLNKTNPAKTLIDRDFAKRLEKLTADVKTLLDKAENTNQTDKVL